MENEKAAGQPVNMVRHPEHTYWDLLERATAAEGKVESILLQLAAERYLDAAIIETLGLFRQAYQQIREAIRDRRQIDWKRKSPEYIAFKALSSEISCFINYKAAFWQKPIPKDVAMLQLNRITAVDHKAWEKQIAMLEGTVTSGGQPPASPTAETTV